ncbi:hypothetical protein BE15_27200 [Sorangium cellulosum]|uniref:Uncharacterized protein n=1 Tax=Sorangium cellulosum TaxID=56 RepID=A0A150QTP1_SORCE|nr:hypothetical protein BE15_27200 [Sorangium cellulosum]
MTRPATRADVVATLAVVLLVVGVVAGRVVLRGLAPRPSPDACAALLDRYVELVLRAATPEPAASLVAERQALAREAAGERGFVRCEADLTQAEVACALQAGNADDLERCLP